MSVLLLLLAFHHLTLFTCWSHRYPSLRFLAAWLGCGWRYTERAAQLLRVVFDFHLQGMWLITPLGETGAETDAPVSLSRNARLVESTMQMLTIY